jgi:hypothetical protein
MYYFARVIPRSPCLRRHWFEMMDTIAKGLQDVKKSVRVADELPCGRNNVSE